jgi:glycosyltransferase involved in cell wall biosynthesis
MPRGIGFEGGGTRNPNGLGVHPGEAPGPAARIKLLQFVPVLAIGGTETQVMNLVEGLDPAKFELSMACLKRYGEFLESIEARRLPLATYDVRSFFRPHAAMHQLRFAWHVRRHRVQIVHTYGFYANVFAVLPARLAGVPVVVASVRELGDYLTPRQRRVQKVMCRFADCIVTNAEAVRQRLIGEGYSPTKIIVIRNGVVTAKWATNDHRGRLRRELGLGPDVPLVAVVARLNPLKGIEDFLDAAAIVSRGHPEAHFLIVGEGRIVKDGLVMDDTGYRRRLEEYAARVGLGRRVVFTGLRTDVPAVLSAVSVSVLPSLSEGLSNVLLESMGAGVPVVATRVGGNGEIVDDGTTGLLVPPRAPAALARAISLLLEDRLLAARLGRAGQRRVVEHFSLERMVRQTEHLYLNLLEGRTAGRAAPPLVGVN